MSKRKLKYGNDWFDTIHSEIRVPREPRVPIEPINVNVMYPQMAPCPPGYKYRPKRKPGQRKCTKETVKSVLSFLQMLATQNRISIFKPRKDKKGYTKTLLTIPQLKSRLTRHGISYKMKMSYFGMLTLARLKKGLPPEYSLREPLEEPEGSAATSAATLMTILETMVETRPKTVDKAIEILDSKGLLPVKLLREFKATGAPKPVVDARVTKKVQDLLREWGIDDSGESESYDDDFDPFDTFKNVFGKRRPKARPRAAPL